MTVLRRDFEVDVTHAMPEGSRSEPVTVAGTVIVDPETVRPDAAVILAVPGGTYHRRYWDLQPPVRTGFSQAEWVAARGDVFVALDYLGGGDSSRPADGDFMTLEVCSDGAHSAFEQISAGLAAGSLVPGLAALETPTYAGFGQSLGGFITMIQQGKYADYAAIAVLGASPLVIDNIPFHRDLTGVPADERRRMIMADNAASSGLDELPMYHGAPRRFFGGIFHVEGVADDLLAYDENECETLISRVSGVDGMTPGYAAPWAERITCPVFLGFGDADVSADPRREPTGYPRSRHITVATFPDMAHMHNFADTREQLWEALDDWLPRRG
jgi:pimeloyl-ACP methyl ester carboxylesterase